MIPSTLVKCDKRYLNIIFERKKKKEEIFLLETQTKYHLFKFSWHMLSLPAISSDATWRYDNIVLLLLLFFTEKICYLCKDKITREGKKKEDYFMIDWDKNTLGTSLWAGETWHPAISNIQAPRSWDIMPETWHTWRSRLSIDLGCHQVYGPQLPSNIWFSFFFSFLFWRHDKL